MQLARVIGAMVVGGYASILAAFLLASPIGPFSGYGGGLPAVVGAPLVVAGLALVMAALTRQAVR